LLSSSSSTQQQVVIWKLRNKIKQRRSSKFQQMDKTGAIGPAGPADKNITMTEL